MRIVFDEPEPGVTVIKLTHSDVPEEDKLVFDYGFYGIVVLFVLVPGFRYDFFTP